MGRTKPSFRIALDLEERDSLDNNDDNNEKEERWRARWDSNPRPAVVFTPAVSKRRFRRPPRYPDYATGPTSMLNNEVPYINEIVIINLACLPIAHMLRALRQMFCNHKESFVYRKYEEFQFIEFCNCTICGKTLRHFFGFDEDIRG